MRGLLPKVRQTAHDVTIILILTLEKVSHHQSSVGSCFFVLVLGVSLFCVFFFLFLTHKYYFGGEEVK